VDLLPALIEALEREAANVITPVEKTKKIADSMKLK
jgi:hypothetical protein